MASQIFPTSHTSTFNPQVNWVPQFKGENYEQWSIQMKSIFIAHGIWDIVQNGYEIPIDAFEEASWEETKKGSYELNIRRDHYALSIIHRGVDETILPKIMDATSAKEAWSILETKYKKLEMMENNPEQVKIVIATDEEIDEDVMAILLQHLEAMLHLVENDDKCCIYKVPEYLKKGKEECYRPLVASIGPVFYNKDPKLETMQLLKRKLLKAFIEHPDNAKTMQEPYLEFVSQHEREIRECYEEQINIPSDEFIEMIVLDAASIIFFFLLVSERDDHPSCNAKMTSLLERKFLGTITLLGRDLFVEENQLPFFVLKGIYNIAFGHINPQVPFTHLALEYIGLLSTGFLGPGAIKSIIDNQKIIYGDVSIKHLVHLRIECCCIPRSEKQEHLVHLRRECCCIPLYDQRRNQEQELVGKFHDFHSAKQLSDAGVKFQSIDTDDPFDITFEKRTGVLRIPKLTLYDTTEAALRSILLFEQYHYNSNQYFADYFIFLDKLIDTVEDIQILQNKDIIINHLGSVEDAKDLFNNLTKNVRFPSKFAFWDVSRDLKEYASKPWNRWKAIFWSRYFNHPWAIIAVIAAVILIILK